MCPHMLRHTFVTTMLDAGVDLRDVQIAARHADPCTTMRYDPARNNLDRHPTSGRLRFTNTNRPSHGGGWYRDRQCSVWHGSRTARIVDGVVNRLGTDGAPGEIDVVRTTPSVLSCRRPSRGVPRSSSRRTRLGGDDGRAGGRDDSDEVTTALTGGPQSALVDRRPLRWQPQ